MTKDMILTDSSFIEENASGENKFSRRELIIICTSFSVWSLSLPKICYLWRAWETFGISHDTDSINRELVKLKYCSRTTKGVTKVFLPVVKLLRILILYQQ
jgi:hypothetical protein